MKKLLFLFLLLNFSALADVFIIPQTNDLLYDSQYPLNEYLVQDTNNLCVFHYLTPDASQQEYLIQVENQSFPGSCLEKGFAKVQLFNQQKELLNTWNGYFMDGFFVGDLPLNAKALKRTSDENDTQYLYFLIDEDKQLKIRYIGTMYSFLDADMKYSAFDACHPFEITLQTSNKALFKSHETFKNLLTVVKGYVQTLCPETRTIILNASDSPSLEPSSIFFTQHLMLDDMGNWIMEPKPKQKAPIIQNPVTIKQNTPAKETVVQDNPAEQLLELATNSGVPILGDFSIHVSEKTNKNVVFADQPFIMKAFGNALDLKAGWYKVRATIQPMDDFEKKRTGLSLKERAALIIIQKATLCKQPLCTDY